MDLRRGARQKGFVEVPGLALRSPTAFLGHGLRKAEPEAVALSLSPFQRRFLDGRPFAHTDMGQENDPVPHRGVWWHFQMALDRVTAELVTNSLLKQPGFPPPLAPPFLLQITQRSSC